MNKKIVIIILLIIALIIAYIVINTTQKNQVENLTIDKPIKKKYKFNGECMNTQCDTLINVINENFENFNHNLYIPCAYDMIETEYDKFEYDQAGVYFLIDNTDIMVAKDYVAMSLYAYYEDDANQYIPRTWIVHSPKSMKQFISDFKPNTLYIMKKNIQQQTDIKIFNSEIDILNTCEESKNKVFPYVVIQELLQNPYLIDGRKINLRIYVLLVKYNNDYRIYMYNDGFMYYTAERFIPNSLDTKVNITTGYIDRSVYDKNPLTIKDLGNYLDDESRPLTPIEKKLQRYNMLSEYLTNNIKDLIKNVFKIFADKIGNKAKLKNNLKFQIYGVDVAVNEDLTVKLMEINKGPDLNSKDKRDCAVKYGLIKDTFKIVDVIDNDKHNGFIRIYY